MTEEATDEERAGFRRQIADLQAALNKSEELSESRRLSLNETERRERLLLEVVRLLFSGEWR